MHLITLKVMLDTESLEAAWRWATDFQEAVDPHALSVGVTVTEVPRRLPPPLPLDEYAPAVLYEDEGVFV